MSVEGRLVGAALVSLITVWALAPFAIRVAMRTDLLDHPRGHKVHVVPTPYLGGVTIMAGFLAGAVALGGNLGRFAPMLVCAVVLLAIGTLDDRRPVPPKYRVLAELAAAAVLTAFDAGWSFVSNPFEQFVLTAAWILGFTNAFNLMDNMDGAAAAVGAVCASGIATLALVEHDPPLAILMVALAGACVGFLRYNLPRGRTARIFLGDGGSLFLGFLIAAAATRIPVHHHLGWPVLLTAGMMLAIPTLDTLLVVVSRTRRGVSVATGGQDHLTHRLRARLGSPHRVAFALASAQILVALVGIAAYQAGRTPIVVASMGTVALGLLIVAVLDSPQWVAAPTDG